MTKTIPALLAALALTLLASGCAAPAAKRSPDRDLLLDCRAKADDTGHARYTGPWESAVRECLDKAGRN